MRKGLRLASWGLLLLTLTGRPGVAAPAAGTAARAENGQVRLTLEISWSAGAVAVEAPGLPVLPAGAAAGAGAVEVDPSEGRGVEAL